MMKAARVWLSSDGACPTAALCFLPPALHSWEYGIEPQLLRSRAGSFVFTPNKASVELRVEL